MNVAREVAVNTTLEAEDLWNISSVEKLTRES